MPPPSPIKHCGLCRTPLSIPGRPETVDCGGDCRRCMAEAGDPSCIQTMQKMGLPFSCEAVCP